MGFSIKISGRVVCRGVWKYVIQWRTGIPVHSNTQIDPKVLFSMFYCRLEYYQRHRCIKSEDLVLSFHISKTSVQNLICLCQIHGWSGGLSTMSPINLNLGLGVKENDEVRKLFYLLYGLCKYDFPIYPLILCLLWNISRFTLDDQNNKKM